MVEFYRHYGKEGKSKADSVRLAQLRLLNGNYSNAAGGKERSDKLIIGPPAADAVSFKPDPKAPFAHPYFWSPFILIGNWR